MSRLTEPDRRESTANAAEISAMAKYSKGSIDTPGSRLEEPPTGTWCRDRRWIVSSAQPTAMLLVGDYARPSRRSVADPHQGAVLSSTKIRDANRASLSPFQAIRSTRFLARRIARRPHSTLSATESFSSKDSEPPRPFRAISREQPGRPGDRKCPRPIRYWRPAPT